MLVKSSRLIVLRVNRKGAYSRDIRSLKRTLHRVFEKSGAKSLALPCSRNRQTGKQHDRHRMTGEAFGQALRRIAVFNLPHHKGVVADNLLIRQSNIGLRRTRLLVLQGITDQKTIECTTTAINRIDWLTTMQLVDSEQKSLGAAVIEDTRFPEKSGKARGRKRRCIQRRQESLPLLRG